MKKRARSIAIILVAFAVTFTSLPIMTGDFKAHAYSTPGQVRTFNATTYSNSSIRLTWKRPSACSGYVLYRNGKYLRVIPKTWTAYNVPKLKAATTYKFQMRTYNVYKRTQYYNSKYRTWTYSRPRYSQWRGRRTRRVNYYRYGRLSPVRTATTGPAKITGLKATAKTHDTTTIQWTKQTKALTGYVVYRNNAYYKTLGKNTNSLKVTGLKANTAYTYKVISYLKVGSRNVYGSWSANLKVTTNKAPAVVAPTPAVQDTLFANSKLSDKTLYIDKSYVGTNDLYYELQTSKEDADSIKWSSSNTNVVEIQRSVMIGIRAKITIKGKGTATITATNWDGQKKTATVTVKSVNDNVTPEPEPEEPDNGVFTRYGKVYPDANGVFNLDQGGSTDFKIGGVDVRFSDLEMYFPTGTKFTVNASTSFKEVPYTNVSGASSQAGMGASVVSISNKNVAIDTTTYGKDTTANGFFFLDAGTTDVTYSNGKVFTFIVSGRNDAMCAYRDYVKAFVESNSGKSKEEIVLTAISECVNWKYGPVNDPFTMVTASTNPGGNCFAKAKLLQRLLSECGIQNYLHISYFLDDNGAEEARHMVNEIIIDGVEYTADPTNSRELYSWSWDSTKSSYETRWNANVTKNRVDSVDPTSIL